MRILGTPLSGYGPPLVLLVVTVIYLVTGYTYSPEARGTSVVAGWVMIVLVALDLLSRTQTPIGQALLRLFNPAALTKAAGQETEHSAGRRLAAIAWVAAFAALIVLIGILYAMPVYIFAAMWLRGRQPLLLCIVVSVATTAFVWALFALLLEIELYPGILFGGY